MDKTRARFWKLMEPEYHRAMMFCRKLAADRERGDDLFQDALVAALTRFDGLRDEQALRPWLYRIIVNTFRSKTRRPWWKKRVALTEEIEHGLAGENPGDAHTARRWLKRAMQSLSLESRSLVTLYELEGWSIADLASLYSLSEGSVKARLFRARRKMKRVLSDFVSKDEVRGSE
ncbi:MAG: RNA polymerase sigma factor [Proteobacteria bacterium]|nr:RNA polymerase sigma factor [Pseudomonadota bacterium]